MSFKLGNSNIIVVLDTQNLNIISIILCFDIFFFFEKYIITPYISNSKLGIRSEMDDKDAPKDSVAPSDNIEKSKDNFVSPVLK